MKKTLLFMFLGCFLSWESFAQINLSIPPNYPVTFVGWTTSGSAAGSDSTIRLTQLSSQQGAIYYNAPQTISTCPNFSVRFDYKVTSGTGQGFTFFFMNQTGAPIFSAYNLSNGTNLGLPSNASQGLALVFDTHDDNANLDNPVIGMYGFPSGVSYVEGTNTYLKGQYLTGQTQVTDGNWHHVELTYASGLIKVYFDNSTTPSITGNYTFPATSGYFGFTGSTGTSFAGTQLIKSVYINNYAPIKGNTTICATNTTTLTNDIPNGTWSTSNANVATVSTSGLVTGIGGGTATITYTLPSGCNSQATSTTVTVNAVPTVNNINNQNNICNGSPTTLVNFGGTPVGNTYNWTNSNTSIGLAASGSGSIASFSGVNNGSTAQVATVVVTPTSSAGCVGAPKNYVYTVNPTPVVNAISNQSMCNGTPTTAVTFSGGLTGTNYNWTNNLTSIGIPSNGSNSIPVFTALNYSTTNAVATITVTPVLGTCSGTPITYTYTIFPTPSVNAVQNMTVCNGANTNPITFTGSNPNITYSWINNFPTIGLGGGGIGNLPSFTALNSTPGTSPTYATVSVTPTLNGCAGQAKYFNIVINPTPTVNSVSNQTICNTLSTDTVKFSGLIPNTNFNWQNNNTSAGLSSSGSGTILPFNGFNSTTSLNVATIIVTPELNNCFGTPKNFNITVKPSPSIYVPADTVLCNGILFPSITLNGTIAGTTYAWSNNKPGINLISSGVNVIPSFIPVNTGSLPIIATIKIKPSANGCMGTTQSFLMKVGPTPSMTLPSSQTLCDGEMTTTTNFNGPVPGTTFQWTSDNTTTGLSNPSGTGKILPFMAINNGSANEIANITVTPSANGCVGNPKTFSYIVKPPPVLLTPSSQTLCNGVATTAVNFVSNVSNTTYQWVNSDSSIGLLSFGNGDIPSFTATNTTITPVTATIKVIPTANGCKGDSRTFNYTVNPSPVINQPSNKAFCNGATTSVINFSCPVFGTTYVWTNNNTNIGLTGSGTGNVYSFTGINPDTSARVGTIQVTPTANNCVGQAKTFTITINPDPTVPSIDIKAPGHLCSNTQYQNFGTSMAVRPDRHFAWSVLNGNLMASGANNVNCLITFPYPATATVTLSNIVNATGCKSKIDYNDTIAVRAIFVPVLVYTNNYFICLQNDVDDYYWGYDDVSTLDSTIIPNEHNQTYYNANPDFNNKYYWVIATQNGCWQKTYYQAPAGVNNINSDKKSITVFPNPVTDVLNIAVEDFKPNLTSLKIMDVYGKLLSTKTVTDKKTQVDVHELPTGVYLISICNDGIQVSTVKFIKN